MSRTKVNRLPVVDLRRLVTHDFGDEVLLRSILSKCKLNRQVDTLQPIIETMCFRRGSRFPYSVNGVHVAYVPNAYLSFQIWHQGINLCKELDIPSLTFLQPTNPNWTTAVVTVEERLLRFPSLKPKMTRTYYKSQSKPIKWQLRSSGPTRSKNSVSN